MSEEKPLSEARALKLELENRLVVLGRKEQIVSNGKDFYLPRLQTRVYKFTCNGAERPHCYRILEWDKPARVEAFGAKPTRDKALVECLERIVEAAKKSDEAMGELIEEAQRLGFYK